MYRIPVVNQNERFLDIDEKPLVNGKIEILDPVSTNPLDIWTYAEDEYTVLTNPVRLDVEGRTPHTVFCDRIVYIRVYKYLGLDEWNQPMYEFVRDYYAGQNENTESREYVIGISALKNLDPSANSSVNVLGYYTAYDCGMRTYVWDENCTLDQDGGYIIGSNVSDSGRWILSFDGMYIPSSYYGVYPGSISNMNALATYVGEINGKKTAPGIYFIPGHYQNTAWFNTTKKLLISANSQFDAGLNCSWVDVKGKPTTWIGDIMPSDSSCPVYSSWYKNARSWWSCASRQKHCDGRNWTNNQLTANVINTSVTFYTDGSNALNTDTGNYYLVFNRCSFVGPGSFLQRDSKCRFQDMHFTDRMYLNHTITPENIEFTNLSGQYCVFDADEFADITNMAKVAYKNGVTELDFKNHSATTVDCTEYTSVINGTFNTMTFGKNDSNQETLKNVTVSNSLVYSGKSLNAVNSTIRLTSFPNLNSIYVSDNSTIKSGFTLSQGYVSCNDSTWSMDTAKTVTAVFNDSIITSTIRSNWISVYNSRISSGIIQVYPYTESSPSSHYAFKCIFENNTFDTDVAFIPDGLSDIYWNVRITNNTFNGSKGLTCPYWVDITTAKRAIAPYTTSGVVHHVDYAGNNGNCPKDRYTGQLDCSLVQYWYSWNPAWMRGKTNPQVQYKVSVRTLPRFFLIENDFAIASPQFTRADDWGFGMRIDTDTNKAEYSLINLSEMLGDSIDSGFNAWAEQHGYTTDNVNDYFMRCRGLPADKYDEDYMYYFW